MGIPCGPGEPRFGLPNPFHFPARARFPPRWGDPRKPGAYSPPGRRSCGRVRSRLREQQDWPWSFPRPSHPLPASLLGNKGASGSWAHLVPGPTPTPALLMWNRVWALPGYCLRWGRGQAEAGNSARSLLHRVPRWRSLPNRPPACLCRARGIPPELGPRAGRSPTGGRSCFLRLF